MRFFDKEKAIHVFLVILVMAVLGVGATFKPVYVVKVNDAEVIAFATQEEAETVLERVKNSYGAGDADYTTTEFKESVEVVKAYSEVEITDDLDYAGELLRNAYLTVITVGFIAETVPIDFDIKYEKTDALLKGQEKVKLSGVTGSKAVVTEVEFENGIIIAQVEAAEAILTEPQAQIVLQGTKEYATLESLVNPTRGTLSSRYGERWNRQHKGIDIAADYGTPIYAAEGGIVISSEFCSSGYGNIVKISHGDGIETWYAHCSSLLVNAGDVVIKGQEIALVGSTGNSTGNHLHFEIRVDGEVIDPLSYVYYGE